MQRSTPATAESREAEVLVLKARLPARTVLRFLTARGVRTAVFDRLPPLLEELSRGHARAVVLELFAAATAADSLRAAVAAVGRPVPLLLVTERGETPQYRNRTAELPNAALVGGGDGFITRLLTALSAALGLSARRHPRRAVDFTGLLRGPALVQPIEVQLLDLSESGARLRSSLALERHQPLELSFGLEGRRLAPRAEVVWCTAAEPSGFAMGLHFRHVAPLEIEALRAYVADRPLPADWAALQPPAEVRAARRFTLPARLRVKARVELAGERRRAYLQVADLSETGFRGDAAFDPGLKPGQRVQTLLSWSGSSLGCECEVARASMSPGARKQPVWQLGLRFVTLNRAARGGLKRLLRDARERGLSAPSAQRSARAAAPAAPRPRPRIEPDLLALARAELGEVRGPLLGLVRGLAVPNRPVVLLDPSPHGRSRAPGQWRVRGRLGALPVRPGTAGGALWLPPHGVDARELTDGLAELARAVKAGGSVVAALAADSDPLRLETAAALAQAVGPRPACSKLPETGLDQLLADLKAALPAAGARRVAGSAVFASLSDAVDEHLRRCCRAHALGTPGRQRVRDAMEAVLSRYQRPDGTVHLPREAIVLRLLA